MDNELLKRGLVPRALTPAQIGALDADGFVILEDVIAPDWLAGCATPLTKSSTARVTRPASRLPRWRAFADSPIW